MNQPTLVIIHLISSGDDNKGMVCNDATLMHISAALMTAGPGTTHILAYSDAWNYQILVYAVHLP